VNPTPATPQPEEIVGYIVGNHGVRDRVWHLDQHCGAVSNCRGGGREAGRGPTALKLAQWLTREHKTPCRACALTAVLDDLGEAANEAGYHLLACTEHHLGPDEHPDELHTSCALCVYLNEYSRIRDAQGTVVNGQILVLRTGALNAETGCGSAAWGCGPMRLDVVSARAEHLPPITAAMWAAAAKLVHAGTALLPALAAASALYNEPDGKATPGAAHLPAGEQTSQTAGRHGS